MFKIYAKITWRFELYFDFEYMLQGWVVINHKSSNCLASKGNPHKLPVKNLINLFRREGLLYLKVIALFFCSRYFNIVLYSPFSPSTWNKRHSFQFIRKPKNLINDKISICLFNNIYIYIRETLKKINKIWLFMSRGRADLTLFGDGGRFLSSLLCAVLCVGNMFWI